MLQKVFKMTGVKTGKQYYKPFQISYHHQTILMFSEVTGKQYHTLLEFSESYYQTILTYSELISNSIRTFTELLSNNSKQFFESLNRHLNKEKILKQKIPK